MFGGAKARRLFARTFGRDLPAALLKDAVALVFRVCTLSVVGTRLTEFQTRRKSIIRMTTNRFLAEQFSTHGGLSLTVYTRPSWS